MKLRYLDSWIDQRNRMASHYLDALEGISGVTLPVIGPNGHHAFHLFVIRTKQPDELASYLKDNEIQTGIHYPLALPKLKAYAHLGQADQPMVAIQMDQELLSLPMGEDLDSGQLQFLCEIVRRFARP